MIRLPVEFDECEQILAPDGRYDGAVVEAFSLDDETFREMYECLNFAGLFDIPVVFLLLNNQWAISTPVE